jgi:hypothetical protein
MLSNTQPAAHRVQSPTRSKPTPTHRHWDPLFLLLPTFLVSIALVPYGFDILNVAFLWLNLGWQRVTRFFVYGNSDLWDLWSVIHVSHRPGGLELATSHTWNGEFSSVVFLNFLKASIFLGNLTHSTSYWCYSSKQWSRRHPSPRLVESVIEICEDCHPEVIVISKDTKRFYEEVSLNFLALDKADLMRLRCEDLGDIVIFLTKQVSPGSHGLIIHVANARLGLLPTWSVIGK